MSSKHEISVVPIARDTVPALATPALNGNDDSAAWHDLAERIVGAVKPADILEDIWVRDVVDLVWDVVRLRRLKAHLFAVGASDGMAHLLRGIGDMPTLKARGWAAREPQAVATVNRMLSAAGLDMGHVEASAFVTQIEKFDRIERMLAAAEARRAAAIDRIEDRRAVLAQQLRVAANAAERAADGAPA